MFKVIGFGFVRFLETLLIPFFSEPFTLSIKLPSLSLISRKIFGFISFCSLSKDFHPGNGTSFFNLSNSFSFLILLDFKEEYDFGKL